MEMKWITFKGMFADSPLWKKLVVLFFFLFFCVFTSSIIATVIVKLLHYDPNSTEALKIIQLLGSAGLFAAAPLLTIYFTEKEPEEFLLVKLVDPRIMTMGLLTLFFLYPFISFTGLLNEQMHLPDFLQSVETWMRNSEDEAKEITLRFLDTHSLSGLIGNIIIIALVPAIGEELLFRGYIQQSLYRRLNNPHVAVWVAAFLFSAIHLQFFGFFPRLFLGAFLGYLYVFTGSILVPMFCHFMNNSIIIILAYIVTPEKALEAETATEATTATAITSIVSLIIAVLFLYFLQQKAKVWKGK